MNELHAECGVPSHMIHRVPGITGVRTMPESCRNCFLPLYKFCPRTIPNPIRIARETSYGRGGSGFAQPLASREMAYDENHPYVVIMEDDVSFEYVDRWHKVGT